MRRTGLHTLGEPRGRMLLSRVGAVVGIGVGAALIAGCGGAPSPAASASATTVAAPSATASPPVPAAPSPTPTVAPHLARSVPVRLEIPSIGVDSPLMDLGLRADGSMEVPPGGFPAGWYTGAPTPGELGPAIIAGHVDWNGPGVFFHLRDLKVGDDIAVTREDGSIATFRVTQVSQFPKDEFPTDQVYGDIAGAGLRLITCGGSFNAATHHYEDNIVAFADFVAAGS